VPRRIIRRLSKRLGRRGAILLCYGVVWAIIGYGQITAPAPDLRGLRLLLQMMPLYAWGWIWVVSGLIAIVSAWLPPEKDWPGFLALPLMVLPWTVSYLLAWILGDYPRGWLAAVVWGAIAAPVLVVAGWREPPRPKRVESY
jgi:di/tricarboxylate transporter